MGRIAILVNIKSIFTDFGADQAYAVAMSYRHIMGDRMFQEMCEPHQTSSFLADILMMLYKAISQDLECVVLFLQTCGVILYAAVTVLLYKELLRFVNREVAHYMCIFFFLFRAKQSVFPEFSNMQIAFSALLLIFLARFFRDSEKIHNLVIAGLFLCLEILAYPTCIITYFAVIVLLLLFSEKKWKNIGIFTFTCAVTGGLYIIYVFTRVGMGRFLTNIRFLAQADSSHSGVAFNVVYYFKGFLYGVLWMGSIAVITGCIYKIIRIRKGLQAKKQFFGSIFVSVCWFQRYLCF